MPGIVSIFCAMLIAVEIAEFSVRIPLAIGGATQYWLMRFTPWFLAMMIAVVIWWSGKLGKVGTIAGFAGAGLAFVVITNYRGTYIWPGIFDLVNMPDSELKIAYLMGVVAGGITLILRTNSKFAPGRISDYGLAGAVVFLGLVEWLASSKFPVESQFAPLRHVSLFVLAVVFSIFLVVNEVTSS
ncbi:MAG: hypothetical protein CBB60_005550 [Armatimonadetes bacterium Cent15-Ar3]|nr:MAG: hypothetical protein CBB60_005550 [Armatimonadetes bacterium Cent15-Ar3]